MTDSGQPAVREPELVRRAEEFRRAALEAEELAGGLSARQMGWRPGPDVWSVAECLEHLVRTGEAYLRVLDRAIDQGREDATTGEGPFRHGLMDRWLVRFLEPPPRFGIPAPRVIDPRADDQPGSGPSALAQVGNPGQAVDRGDSGGSPLPRFIALQDRLSKRLGRADGLDLSGIRVSSPFFSFLRMDLGTVFAVVAAHQRRHLWQAGRVVAAEGFPRG